MGSFFFLPSPSSLTLTLLALFMLFRLFTVGAKETTSANKNHLGNEKEESGKRVKVTLQLLLSLLFGQLLHLGDFRQYVHRWRSFGYDRNCFLFFLFLFLLLLPFLLLLAFLFLFYVWRRLLFLFDGDGERLPGPFVVGYGTDLPAFNQGCQLFGLLFE